MDTFLMTAIAVVLIFLVVMVVFHRHRINGPAFVTFKGVKDNGTPAKRLKAIKARQAARDALVKQMKASLQPVPRGTMKFRTPDGRKHKRSY